MCQAIHQTNKELGEEDEEWALFILSMDVKAMYPFLDIETVAEEIEQEMRNSHLEFENIDDMELAKHLSVTETLEDIIDLELQDVILTRSINQDGRSRKVTMAYLDQDNGDKWNWYNKAAPSQQQRKKMVARTIRRAVEYVWTNHLIQIRQQGVQTEDRRSNRTQTHPGGGKDSDEQVE